MQEVTIKSKLSKIANVQHNPEALQSSTKFQKKRDNLTMEVVSLEDIFFGNRHFGVMYVFC